MKETASVPPLQKWLIAVRPWSLPASTMPVLFGTSLAVGIARARLDVSLFLLAFLGMVLLHLAANMLSDVFDFRRGLDRQVTPVSGAIVRGWLPDEQVLFGSIVLFALGCAIGLYLVARVGWILFFIGGAGVAIGVGYSVLKVYALGDLAVFLNFGILGSLGAWVVQTRTFSWIPVLWTIPMAMLVSAILHANNWRDSTIDKEKGVTSLASLIGDRGSLLYYGFLIFGPFAIDLGFIFLPRFLSRSLEAMPFTFLIVFLAIPNALFLWERARHRHSPRRPLDFVVLDGATSRFNLIFGLLSTAAVWLFLLYRIL